MKKEDVKNKLQAELDANTEKLNLYLDNLHDGLLGISSHSVKDMSMAVLHCHTEEKRIQVCLDALER